MTNHYAKRSKHFRRAAGVLSAAIVVGLLSSRLFAANPGDVVINEIMSDPQGTDANHEWLEVRNNTASPIDLSTWKLFENGTNRTFTSVQNGTVVPAGGYALICSSSTFLTDYSTAPGAGSWVVLRTNFSSLTNTGETLVIKDPALAVISSVSYSLTAPWPAMLTGSSSLERISPTGGDNDPANWASSRARGSPAAANDPIGAGTPAIAAMGTFSTGDYTVAWSSAANAAQYELQESAAPDFSSLLNTFVVTSTDVAVAGRASGTYYYRVRGKSAGGLAGDWSVAEDAVVNLTPPPGSLTLNPIADSTTGAYPVSWSAATGANVYELQESTSLVFATLLATYWPVASPQSVTGRTTGVYYYRVRGWSALPASGGVNGPWSNMQSAGVDTVPPSAALTAPVAGSTVSATVPVSGTASDDLAVAFVDFKTNAGFLLFHDTATPFGFSLDSSALPNGANTLYMEAHDFGGNVGTSASIQIFADNGPDAILPSASLTAPANGATLIGVASVTATASDNRGVARVEFIVDDANLRFTDSAAPYAFQWDTRLETNGAHSLKAVAYDATGNSASSAINVTVDNPPPPLVVNEIMYDPAGTDSNREWVEIYNKSAQPVNLTGWKIFDGSDHSLTFVQGGSTLAAGGFAVIASSASLFINEYSTAGSSGWMVIDSVLSLSNTTDTAALKDSIGVVNSSVTYTNASPWPLTGAGQTIERKTVAGADDDPANWQAGPIGGSPGSETLPPLTVPTVDPVPAVFFSTGGASGGFLTVSGSAAFPSDVVVVVHVNGLAFEQSPVTTAPDGRWQAQVGIFGSDGDQFQLAAYARRVVGQTAESAAQNTVLNLLGVTLDPVATVFSTTGTNGGFMPVSGYGIPGASVTVELWVPAEGSLGGNGYGQGNYTVAPDGRWSGQAHVLGPDGAPFQITAALGQATTPRQGFTLDLNGEPMSAPFVQPVPPIFAAVGTPSGAPWTLNGWGRPGTEVVPVVRTGGQTYEQSPVLVGPTGSWSQTIGLYGNDGQFFQVSAYSRLGGVSSAENGRRGTVLDLNGQEAPPEVSPIPALFVSTGSNGGYLTVSGKVAPKPGFEIAVVVTLSNGSSYVQPYVIPGWDGEWTATAGLFGNHLDAFQITAYQRDIVLMSVRGPSSAPQTTVLDLVGPPAAPAIAPMGTSTSRDYSVTWNAVPNAFIYQLQESTSATFDTVSERWPQTPGESFTAQPDGVYYYRVRAWNRLPENNGLASAWSATEDVTVAYQFPANGVVISEIMYDPAGTDGGHEWIEIFNKTNQPANLAGWKLFEGGTNHSVTFVQGGSTLAAGGYAILTDSATLFLTDYSTHPNAGNWLVLDTSFGLTNTGETVALKDAALNVMSTVTFSSAAPWPVLAGQGSSIERKDPDGGDNDPANWQSSSLGGSPGSATLAPLATPAVNAISPVFNAIGTPSGGFLTLSGSAAGNSEVVVVVRTGGGTYEQGAVTVPSNGQWSAQAGLFGSDGQTYQISAYSRRGAQTTAESAAQTTVLELDGVPAVDAISPFFAASGSGGFLAVSGLTVPGTPVTVVVRTGGATYPQGEVTADAAGRFTSQTGLFGSDGQIFQISAYARLESGNSAESPQQTVVLDLDGNILGQPVVDALPRFFTASTPGGFLTVAGSGTPGSETVVVVETGGGRYEQSPALVNAEGRFSMQAGIFGGDGQIFRITAFGRIGSTTTAETAPQTTVLDTDGNHLGVPAPDALPAVFLATGTSGGGFLTIAGAATPGSSVTVRVRVNGGTYDQSSVVAGDDGRFSAQAGLFGPDRARFDVTAFAQLDGATSAESPTQSVTLDLFGPPAAPVINAMTTSSSGEYPVSWPAVDRAVIYELQETTSTFASVTDNRWPGATSETFSRNNGTYLYRVRAWNALPENGGLASGWSAVEDMMVILSTPPAAPTIGTMTNSNSGRYTVSWNGVSGAVIYELQESTNSFATVKESRWPGANNEPFADRADGTYYYRVRAWNAAPENGGRAGDWSAVEDIVVTLPQAPAAPVIAPLGTSTTGTYDVAWGTVAFTYIYELQESTTSAFATVTASFWPTAGHETATGRTDGTYYYRVRGWTSLPEFGGISSAWSATEDITVNLMQSFGTTFSGTVGPSGGSVGSNGFVSADFAPGALGGDTTITVTPLDCSRQPSGFGAPAIPAAAGYEGHPLMAAEFGPHGSHFTAPVTLRFKFLDKDNDGYAELPPGGEPNELPNSPEFRKENLRVFWLSGGRWTLIGGKLGDDGFVSVQTDHFSTYALFPAAPAPAATPTQRFVTPNADGANDAAVFGTGVTKVEISDSTGKSVWADSGDGVTAIQWAGVDDRGDSVETGAYIYRAEETNGTVTHGVIVVAR